MAAHDQEVDWLADPEATIEQALLSGTQARQAAQDVLPTLPRKDASRHYPATLQDALSLVHSREDAKKKQAANQAAKAKHKALSGAFPGTDGHFPGAVEGGGDAGAYWMYLEDYFRDVTQEDFHDILPLLLPPREDPAFAICPPGSGNAIPPASTSQALAKPKAKSPPPPPPPPPPPIATLPTPDGTGGLVQERRSSRLVIRLSRGTDLPRYTEDDSDLLEDGMGGEEDGPGASSGHLSAIQQQRMPILRAADGQPASQLWDAVEDRRLALLALQLTALKDAVAGFVDVVKPASGKRLAKSVLQVATRAAGGGKARLSNDVRSQLLAWLEETAAVLTETLGCRVQLPILGLRRDIGAESREPGPSRPAGRSLKPANGTGAQSQHAVDNEVEVLNEARSAGDTTHDKNGNGNGNDNGAAMETGTTVETKAEHDAGIAAVGGPHSPPRPNPEQRPWSPAEAEEAHAPPQPSILSLPSSSQVHPYMRLLLRAPVPRHVRTAAVEGPFVDPALVAVLGRTPSVANLAPADGGEPPTGISNAATPTTSGVSEGDRPVSGLVVGSHARPRRALTPATCMGGGAAQHGVAVPRKDAGGMYGRRPAQQQQGVASGAAGGQPTLLQQHPVAQAVAVAVAEGAADGLGDGQFSLATSDPGVLAAAPQDEITAETLAVQAELAAVSAANRARLSVALQRLLEDLPRQRAAAATRAKEEADVKAWIMEAREATEKELRQRREAAHREALAAVGPGGLGAPRPVLGGGSVPVGEGGRVVAPYLGPEDMYDVLAQRREDEESFCAVCGDGSSMEPNVIVFCDRCDVAVHQHCYDVAEVPESEWLCWPCKEYEDMLRAQGVPQATIRPPGALPEDRRRLPGGSREVKCALCPIKCGAFRRTVDGQQWVHTACALWHLDSKIHATWRREGPNAIDGLSKILPKRWTEACDICGKVDGAVINCKHPGGCQFKFHVLCARNTGLYLTVRSDQQGRPSYRIYCAVHSRQQQEKDARAAMARMEAQDRVYERMVREENRRLALEGLAAMEEEQSLLNMLRINLEQCRVLLDQCKRREKLKRQAAMIAKDAHQERLQDPAAALAHLQKIDEMRNGGMGPAEQLVALGMSPGNAAALAAEGGALHHQIQPMEQQPNMFALGVQARLPFTSPDTASDALQMAGASDDSLMMTGTTASGRPRRAAVAKRHFQSEPAASPHIGGGGGGAAALGGLMPSESKRPRRGVSNTLQAVASTQAPANSGATALQALPTSADSLLIQRQQMMSTAEAEALNSRLPPGVKYVLLEQLPASLSHVEAGTDAPAAVGRPSRTGTRSNPSSAAPSTLVQQQQQPSKGENAATRASARLRQTRS